MRRGLCALMMTLVLPLAACGGGGGNEAEALALEVRSRYLEMTACAGHLELTADYGQRVYVYGVDLTWEKEGETVPHPHRAGKCGGHGCPDRQR